MRYNRENGSSIISGGSKRNKKHKRNKTHKRKYGYQIEVNINNNLKTL